MSQININIRQFTKDEFRKVREILDEWNYEWLDYELRESNSEENVDVTFFLDDDFSLGEFVYLIFNVGQESVYHQ